MANQFIGLHMLVTLRNSPARLKGTVSDIEAGQSLTLVNVWLLDTNQWQPRVTIQASHILELSEVQETQQQTPSAPAPAPAVSQAAPAVLPPSAPKQPAPAPFVDPAILSFGKRPEPLTKRSSNTDIQTGAVGSRGPLPENAVLQSEDAVEDLTPTSFTPGAVRERANENKPPAVTFERGDDGKKSPQSGAAPSEVSKRKRRPRRGKDARGTGAEQDEGGVPDNNAANRGKGWRQTPILQSTESFQPFNSLKPSRRGRNAQANDNEWASEDVTDVQEMGDFDFEGSLAKFDKNGLFDQMRKDDKIDEAERLVSHNRQSRPKQGATGSKNLHYSENVLDLPSTASRQPKEPAATATTTTNDFWNSEADDGLRNGGERLSGRDQGSRQSSRRGESKVSTSRRSQSRKASAVATGAAAAPARVNSGVSTRETGRRLMRDTAAVPVDKKKQLLNSTTSPGLYLLPSNRRVEPISALQMLNLENIAHNELGLTDDMMTENAGRGIAEVSLTALSHPAIKVRAAGAVSPTTGGVPPPTIVVLAGNNKSGARAVAAARHLRNKGINVLVCVVGMDRGLDGSLLEDMRQQVRLFKNFGGRIFNKTELFEHLRKVSIPTLSIDAPRTTLGPLANPAPVTLIVDALLGLAVSFEELRTSDQASVYELIEWANRNEAFVLAVDVPTGIDPSTGKISIIDGCRLFVKPRYVVSMAAPKRGLVEAIAASDALAANLGSGDEATAVPTDAAIFDDPATEWKLFVVDVGFGASVWKKAGTKVRRGVDFDEKWVCEMVYRRTPGDAER